ncbi:MULTISPECIES: TonB-dependent receptor [Acinetobacter]|jgi:hypothetical protein|uniref:TonB-dependent receptor n=1 Tax=Acinetobacter TaxID=469 RepID=UPI000C434952|nr:MULTISPECIES: TonB-dependent receptor [Acinetobacter]MBC67408.1 TonB-dependent receptor [Acinetobacter sp.]MBT50663.1 TonB-dependent receptor [Acinetobacter sp.]HIQ34465.1 TonB-dependent receptor [Acinetobacter venetianus]|tara:strand:+ start:1178 stop:1600 length:423 start_codon:yes stop_codon:yes gene_type:complete
MLNKLFFCALFLSLSGCAATQVDYIKVEKLDPYSTDRLVIDGVEFNFKDISNNENIWVYLPNITVYNSELENRYREIEFLVFIDERGYVRHIKVYKSTGLENLDRKIVHLLTNKARTKIWLKDGKPEWIVAQQKMVFIPE